MKSTAETVTDGHGFGTLHVVTGGPWGPNTACNQVIKWREAGLIANRASVNLSGRRLDTTESIDHIMALIAVGKRYP